MLDIFRSDAFSVINLTGTINTLPFVPGRLGQMGLFEESGVTTTTVTFEEKAGTLSLVSPSPRGAPGETFARDRRGLRALAVPHFQIDDAVFADEVQGVRAFGSETALATVEGLVRDRMMGHAVRHDATLEYQRIGAVKGIITYADGSTTDLFSEFGVSQETEVNFDLSAGSPVPGILRETCDNVIEMISNNLGAQSSYQRIHALCGAAFWKALVKHSEIRDTYDGWSAAAELRRSMLAPTETSWGSFEFGGIMWERYRGKVGATDFVDTDKCHIFPVGVPGLFRTFFAPADYIETVNTRGLPRYAKMIEMRNGKGYEMETQTNPLSICTRPKVLIKGKRTA